MVNVPSTNDAGSKFSRNGQNASQDYSDGVANSSDSAWQEATLQAEDNWTAGVQEAANNGSFGRGVQNPSASWQQRAQELGSQRFGPGIAASQDKYETAVAPYFDALEALTLEPRGPRNSPQNYNRVERVGQRLSEVRSQR